MFKNAKKEFYSNLNQSLVVDNRSFWKTVKSLFSEKQTVMNNISLNDNNEILTEDIDVASCFGEYFDNAELRVINEFQFLPYDSPDQKTETVTEVIERYKNHPSILKIVEVMDESCTFSFSMVSINEVRHEINKLCIRKSSPIESIPPKIILHNSDIFACLLHKNFNNSLITCTFPENLKLADVTPAHKKGDRMDKINYRPISILSPINNIFESLLYNQVNSFFENKFSKLKCGFRKGLSTQHCLIYMLEKWKKSVDMKKYVGALLTDLSKAFDCISHDLLIAKFHAYGFDLNTLNVLSSYLKHRFQRVKVNSAFSIWFLILCGVPQGSKLGPLIFNIYLIDLFISWSSDDLANYADDNTPYAISYSNEEVISQLEAYARILFEWLRNNCLKANPDKSHLILSRGGGGGSYFATIDDHEIQNSQYVKLLGKPKISCPIKNLPSYEYIST